MENAERNEEVDDRAVVEPPAEAAAVDVLEYRDKYLRLQADLDNYRKRLDRSLSESIRRRKADLLFNFLPVVDNLTRAIDAADAAPSNDGLLEGVRLTCEQLLGILERQGVSRIPDSDEFDPRLQEVVATTPRDDVVEGSVLEVLATGYLLDGELLRAAAVRVATSGRHDDATGGDSDSNPGSSDPPLDVQA